MPSITVFSMYPYSGIAVVLVILKELKLVVLFIFCSSSFNLTISSLTVALSMLFPSTRVLPASITFLVLYITPLI